MASRAWFSGLLRFGLRQRHLGTTRIDFRQDLTRLHPLTMKPDADELAVQSAAHDHRDSTGVTVPVP